MSIKSLDFDRCATGELQLGLYGAVTARLNSFYYAQTRARLLNYRFAKMTLIPFQICPFPKYRKCRERENRVRCPSRSL